MVAKQGVLDDMLTPAERCAEELLELKDDVVRAKDKFEAKRELLEGLMADQGTDFISVSGTAFRLVNATKLKLEGYKKPGAVS